MSDYGGPSFREVCVEMVGSSLKAIICAVFVASCHLNCDKVQWLNFNAEARIETIQTVFIFHPAVF